MTEKNWITALNIQVGNVIARIFALNPVFVLFCFVSIKHISTTLLLSLLRHSEVKMLF